MPFAPPKPCTYPGCRSLTTKGSRCDLHPYERTRSRTVSQYKYLYNTKQWKVGRLTFLSKNPLCVDCKEKNIIESATVVDHKVAHNGDMKLFFDSKNWQGLCKPCHDRKTATHDGGFGNRRK